MTNWQTEIRTCDCGSPFKPRRADQRYCGKHCRDKVAKRRRRSMDKSGDKNPDLGVVPRSMDMPLSDSPTASEWDTWPVCPVCKLWEMLPRKRLPRHMFCIAVRRARLTLSSLAEAA
jgi:hypothetical protein